jgi:uncharacterized protein (TIGR00725 family)
MKVTIFGGAQPKPGEPAYQDAYRLGQMLGQAGHVVLTGGYVGTMEAASWGASEAGGHVIGITCEDIERQRSVKANQYVMEEIRFPTLNERLMGLVFNCDAAIALPGGLGTLAEIAMFWNHVAIKAIPARPFVVVGEGWKATVDAMFQNLSSYVAEADQVYPIFVKNVDEAFEAIQKSAVNGQ